MIKEYVGILVVGVIIALILITGFSVVGSPVSQRLVSLDTTRLSDFNSIKWALVRYYEYNKKLPADLDEVVRDRTLSYEELQLKDPETGKNYEYKIVTPTSYKLCTSFSVGSKDLRGKTSQAYLLTLYEDDDRGLLTFEKGFNCLEYKLSSSLTTSPTPHYPAPNDLIVKESACKDVGGAWKNNSCEVGYCKDEDNTLSPGDASYSTRSSISFGSSSSNARAEYTDICSHDSMQEMSCIKRGAVSVPSYADYHCPNGCVSGVCKK